MKTLYRNMIAPKVFARFTSNLHLIQVNLNSFHFKSIMVLNFLLNLEYRSDSKNSILNFCCLEFTYYWNFSLFNRLISIAFTCNASKIMCRIIFSQVPRHSSANPIVISGAIYHDVNIAK